MPNDPPLITRCPVCGEPAGEPFLALQEVPVLCNVLWDSPEDARSCTRGNVELTACPSCTLLYNRNFDPARVEYTAKYDNCLHHSSRFVEYAADLADRLGARYELEGKLVVEVGSGKGDFLKMLCGEGTTRGLGFDPSYEGAPARVEDRVRIFPRYYDETATRHGGDLLVCRQVLEHILNPVPFLEGIARGIERHGVPVFFEVPNGSYTLRNAFVWDVIYEHPVYYTPAAIRTAFGRAGYSVRSVAEEFEGQYLGIHATTGTGETDSIVDTEGFAADVTEFRRRFGAMRETWKETLHDMERRGERAVVWGAGSKGITFLNLVGESPAIDCAVDVSPAKQGRYVSGTGHAIVSPDGLVAKKPDVVFLMNPVYRSEVEGIIRRLGIPATLECL